MQADMCDVIGSNQYDHTMAIESSDTLSYRPHRRPSLRDLAKKLDVSHTAVARALRGEVGLSDELRQRILKRAQKEGYVFNDIVDGLVRGQTGIVGVIVPRLAVPFVDTLVSGIADALWKDQVVPIVLNSQLDPQREEAMLQMLSTKRVDALIIMPCMSNRSEDHFVHLIKRHAPIVALDNAMANVDAPLVASDDRLGGELVARHLLKLGHRKIAHIGMAEEYGGGGRDRRHGFKRVLQAHGLKPRVVELPHRQLRSSQVIPVLDQWLGTREGRTSTAVFAYNDMIAWALYAVARRRGLRIGQDLAVVGYGNTRSTHPDQPDVSDLLTPALTSVEQYPHRWGQAAVDIVLRMVAGKPVPRKTLFKPSLVVGRSCGKLQGKARGRE